MHKCIKNLFPSIPLNAHTPKLSWQPSLFLFSYGDLVQYSISGFPTKIFLVGINKNVEREKEMHKFAILGPFNSAQHTHIDTTWQRCVCDILVEYTYFAFDMTILFLFFKKVRIKEEKERYFRKKKILFPVLISFYFFLLSLHHNPKYHLDPHILKFEMLRIDT